MKILTLIIFVVALQISLLQADGFYMGGSMGYTLSNNTSINISGLNQETKKSFQSLSDETYVISSENIAALQIRVIQDAANTYSAILKEISYKESSNAPTFAMFGGYAFKNLRFEGEIKGISMKIKAARSIYDVHQDYSSFITTYCSVASLNAGYCDKNATKIDSSDPLYNECKITMNSSYGISCYLNNTNIEKTNLNSYNNIVIGNSNNPVFSSEIDSQIFNNGSLTSTNVVGFMNFLYELGITKSIVAFAGLGAGYGIALISSDLTDKQNITYPAYQIKIGSYYALNSNIDITLNYSSINTISNIKTGNFEFSSNNIQSIELGVRYNFFNRSTSFFEDYNYKKIFRLP
ncbi:MAG: hypothetical protein FWE18_06950 [Alphaproteobacteria bacterium]|nr:hypothetical protein [Alphaproteobacteria bacterium]